VRGFKKLLLSLAVVAGLSHCSQSRRGNIDQNSEIWAAQEVCATGASGDELRCMSIEPNITENYAIVTITQLDFNPAITPYRLLARAAGQSTWHLLADQVTIPAGGYFEVNPKNGVYIEEYEEYLLESATGPSSDGLNIAAVSAGRGVPLIWGFVDYPELYQESGY